MQRHEMKERTKTHGDKNSRENYNKIKFTECFDAKVFNSDKRKQKKR